MTDSRLRGAQAVTGLVFSLFLSLHLFNQAVAVRGAAAYDSVQGALRAGYQVPAVEVALVLMPLLVHAGLAVAAMWRRRRAPAVQATWPARLHRWSGRFLLVVFLGHVGATRIPALLADAAPGFAGVAFTFKWVPAWFWPYYAALALAGWLHLLFGLSIALPRITGVVLGRRALFATLALGAVALLAGVVGFGLADDSVRSSAYARWWLSRQ